MKDTRNSVEVLEIQGGMHIKVESEFKLTLSLTRSAGPVNTQIDGHDEYWLPFQSSTYGQKDKKITFPMLLVSCQNKFRVDQTCRKNLSF
jgi:hypothetical protein